MKEIIMYRDQEIEILPDENAESPDSWGCDDAFIVYDHNQFYVKRKGFDSTEIFEHCQEIKRMFYNGYYVFPVYAYIHSGVSLSLGKGTYPFNDRWDVSMKGFCLVKRMKGMWFREKCYKLAESIVEEWNMYLCGDVWGYNSEFGSCWGFYGEGGKTEMIAEAKAEIDSALEQKRIEIDKLQLKLAL